MATQIRINLNETNGIATRIKNRGESQGTQTVELYENGTLVAENASLTLSPDGNYVLEAPDVFDSYSYGDSTTIEVVSDDMTREVDVDFLGFVPSGGLLDGRRWDVNTLSDTTSDGDDVAWANHPDEEEFYSLSGSYKPTYRSNSLNGNDVLEFDGTDDYLFDDTISLTAPWEVYFALDVRAIDTYDVLWMENNDNTPNLQADGSKELRFNIGGSLLYYQNYDTQQYIIGARVDSSGTASLRVNGDVKDSANTTEDFTSGFRIGSDSGGSDNSTINAQRLLLYDGDSGNPEGIETYLSNNTGIPLQ